MRAGVWRERRRDRRNVDRQGTALDAFSQFRQIPRPIPETKALQLRTNEPYVDAQRHLAQLTGHAHASVRPYGKHLLVQMRRDDDIDTVARLTEVARNSYTASCRSHTVRWEPLPISGDLKHAADAVTTFLAPYFEP